MKIKTNKYYTQAALLNFCAQGSTNGNFHLEQSFDLSDDTIWVKIKNVEEDRIYLNVKLPFSDIQKHKDFSDQSLWEFKIDGFLGDILTQEAQDTPVVATMDQITNVFQKTLYNKSDYVFHPAEWNGPFKLFVPSINSSLSDCTFIVRTTNDVVNPEENQTNTFTTTFTGPDGSTATVSVASDTRGLNGQIWKQHLSIPQVDSSEVVDGQINVQISVADTSVTKVYLEQQVGIINKSKVDLVNGVGSFSVSTAGLTTGDTVRVRLGYKFTTNLNEFTYTI
jgi:hypothetical protein